MGFRAVTIGEELPLRAVTIGEEALLLRGVELGDDTEDDAGDPHEEGEGEGIGDGFNFRSNDGEVVVDLGDNKSFEFFWDT